MQKIEKLYSGLFRYTQEEIRNENIVITMWDCNALTEKLAGYNQVDNEVF